MSKKDAHLRTEAAIKKALRDLKAGTVFINLVEDYEISLGYSWYEALFFRKLGADNPDAAFEMGLVAIADLRDLYKKRAPLVGVEKKMRAIVRPVKSKKKTVKKKK